MILRSRRIIRKQQGREAFRSQRGVTKPQAGGGGDEPAETGCSVEDGEVCRSVKKISAAQARTKRRPVKSPKRRGVKFLDEESMRLEHCFVGFGSFSRQSEADSENNVFNLYTFIKNAASLSQLSKPHIHNIPKKTRSTPEATLVLGLEETLVYSSLTEIAGAEFTFRTYFQDCEYEVFLILRPYVRDFLQRMSKVFEMFVYTSAKKEYAERILEILDPQKKLFRHRLYQEDCSCVLGHYVKDLNVLERNLAKTVVLDKAPHTFPYHVMNAIPIKSWTGEKQDRELQKMMLYLERLVEADDFRLVLKRRADHLHRLLSED